MTYLRNILLCSIETQTDVARNFGTLRYPTKTTPHCHCQKDQDSEKFNKFVAFVLDICS